MRPATLLIGVLLVLSGGIWLGGHPETLPGPVRDALVDTGPATRAEVIEVIQERFYRDVSKRSLEEASLRGIVNSLEDPYSRYFSPREAEEFSENISGRFEGVGMSVHPNRRGLEITTTFPGSPAREAGMRQGDIITHVNGSSIAGESINDATDKIKGPPGTFVTLRVLRGKKSREFRVKRARIEVPEVEGRVEKRGGRRLAIVSLASFSSGSHGKLRKEIDSQLSAGADGIVLDLRGNPGGLLREGVLVSSIFLENGVVVSTDGRAEPKRVYEAEGKAIDPDVPVVVLVDRGSASASEIVTGALRDRERARVVGTRTYGKGVFQEIESLKNGGAIDLTVGRYYLPSGKPLPRNGIRAQVRAQDDPKTRRDEAIDPALRELLREL